MPPSCFRKATTPIRRKGLATLNTQWSDQKIWVMRVLFSVTGVRQVRASTCLAPTWICSQR